MPTTCNWTVLYYSYNATGALSIFTKDLRQVVVILSWFDDLYRRIDDVIPTPSPITTANGTEKNNWQLL